MPITVQRAHLFWGTAPTLQTALCLNCLLVLDYTYLCRSIYLRGIPFEGLPTIFYRQLARKIRVCVQNPVANLNYTMIFAGDGINLLYGGNSTTSPTFGVIV